MCLQYSTLASDTCYSEHVTQIFNIRVREGFNKIFKKKYGIFHKGGGVPPNFGSVSILFFLFLNMV